MVSKSTRIHYNTAPLIATERESLYENIMQYAPNILERTPATMALLSEPRSTLAGEVGKSKKSAENISLDEEQGSDAATGAAKADCATAPSSSSESDSVNGDEADSSCYAATIKYRDEQGNYTRKRVSIEHPYMLIFMQSYMNEYTNLVQRLLTNSNNREVVEQTLQEMLRYYHGLLMNEYRNLFYVMLSCAPKVLMLMLRFEFWRDLYLQKHDLVVDLDLHSQLRQTSDEYNQLVLDYQEYALNAQRYIAKTKHFTIQEAARLKRLARYQRLKKQKKPIPKELLQALSQDEQDLLEEERIRQLNEKERIYAALKNDYQTVLPPEGHPLPERNTSANSANSSAAATAATAAATAATASTSSTTAADSKPSKTKNNKVSKKAQAELLASVSEDFELDEETRATINNAANSLDDDDDGTLDLDALENFRGFDKLSAHTVFPEEFIDDEDDFESSDEVENGQKLGDKRMKHTGTNQRRHKGNHLGGTTIKSKGTRNLNSNYILLQKLATTPTTGPIDGRSKRDSLPKLGKGQYRRVALPQTFEVRRYIDTVATFLERDREQMFSALISMCSNHGRLKAIYGDNYKRFNLNDARFEDLWLNLETMDQPCMVLYLGSSIEVRPHNTKRSIYNAQNTNYNFVVLDGLDFRIGNVPKQNKESRQRLSRSSLNSTLIPTKSADDNLDNPNAHFNIIKVDQLSPYELIYIKL